MDIKTAAPLCIARIYLRRRSEKRRPGFWGWLIRPPLARHLAEEALKADATALLMEGIEVFVMGLADERSP